MPLLPSQLATCDRYHDREPRPVPGDSCPAWITRGANFVVAVSRVRPGDTLQRNDADEYVLLLPDTPGLSADVQASGQTLTAGPDSLTIVPPGPSTLHVKGAGLLVRVFPIDAGADLLPLASNQATYATPNPDAAPIAAWPEPVGGYRLRHYRLAEHVTEGTQMRIFCTRKLMINPLLARTVARDVRKLSPHSHADFEQGSLALSGTYVHHLRYPWVPDMTLWREDQAEQMGSPSLLVVPPKVVHTSRNIDAPGVLVDIFAPPRLDFARKGVVRNGDEYPMPQQEPAHT